MPMEAILQDIKGVIGVTGSFVCLNDSSIAAQAMPASFDAANIVLTARIASQTFQALEISGQRIGEIDLTFEQARVVLKNLRVGVFVIFCARSINLPLLNLTTSTAVRRLTEELKAIPVPGKSPTVAPVAATEPTPAVAEELQPVIAPSTPPAVSPIAEPEPMSTAAPVPTASALSSPSFVCLETEWRQIMDAVGPTKTTLREMGALAIWLSCSQTRTLLPPPSQKRLEFAAHAAQRDAIRRAFESAGYQTNLSPDDFRSAPRLTFANPARNVTAEIYLNMFALYHQLDLTPFLTPEDAPLVETALLLSRLQLVEMPETGLHELAALFHDHEVSTHAEPGKIDLTQIARLCADQWGWYKTVTMNLRRAMAFAIKSISAGDNAIVTEHAARVLQAIEDAPKSLRWQTRARVGETVRWYDVPVTATPEKQAVEIRYID